MADFHNRATSNQPLRRESRNTRDNLIARHGSITLPLSPASGAYWATEASLISALPVMGCPLIAE
eukprot:1063853-Pyramimonas_sp.AAC.1